MKEMMQKLWVLITFEEFTTRSKIELRFKQVWEISQEKSDAPTTVSVRHNLVYEFWYNYVIKHFFSLFIIAVIVSSLLNSKISLPVITITGLIFFSGFYLFFYQVIFRHIFLPNLDYIESKFNQNLKKHLSKCRQAQLPNFTLVLINYIIGKISVMSSISCDDKSASRLTELYGVDTGSIKKSLELIYMKNKRKHLTERQITEYKNRFNEAFNYFEMCGCIIGMKSLKELETDFFKRNV